MCKIRFCRILVTSKKCGRDITNGRRLAINPSMFRKFKIILIVQLFLFTFHFANAQSDTLHWHEGIRLQSNDFAKEDGPTYVDVRFGYKYYFQRSAFGKATAIIQTDIYLNRRTSTIYRGSDDELRYAQLEFDIEGYHGKLVRHEAMKLGKMKGPDNILAQRVDSVLHSVEQQVAQLRKDFRQDLRTFNKGEVLRVWEGKISGLLEKTVDIEIVDEISKLQSSIFIGIGSNVFAGKTGDYFTNSTGVNVGFDFDVKKSRFTMDLNLGGNRSKKFLEKEGEWAPDLKTTVASIEFSYGYKFTKEKWLVIPYLGLAVNEITPRKNSREDKRSLTGFSPVVGVELNNIIRLLSTTDTQIMNLYWKAKLSVCPTNFVQKVAGPQINLRLDIGMSTLSIKKKHSKKSKLTFM